MPFDADVKILQGTMFHKIHTEEAISADPPLRFPKYDYFLQGHDTEKIWHLLVTDSNETVNITIHV